MGQSYALDSPGIVTAGSPGTLPLPELPGHFCTYRIDENLEQCKASMHPPLASTKTFGADTRPFSFWANPSLANLPTILNLDKQSLSGWFLELPAPGHPHSSSGFIPQISRNFSSCREDQSFLCFEPGLPKGNGQVGFQPKHPLLTALFFNAGYYRH